jgi:hypothetical protein
VRVCAQAALSEPKGPDLMPDRGSGEREELLAFERVPQGLRVAPIDDDDP